MALYDYIKYITSLGIIDNMRCQHTFPRVPLGDQHITGTVDGLREGVDIESRSGHKQFLIRRFVTGWSIQLIVTYVELHDWVLSKMFNAFFVAIPSTSPLSSSATCAVAKKVEFDRLGDAQEEYYTDDVYSDGWRTACYTALRKLRPDVVKARRNVVRYNPDCFYPYFHQRRLRLFLSIFGFVVLMVCFLLFLIFLRL